MIRSAKPWMAAKLWMALWAAAWLLQAPAQAQERAAAAERGEYLVRVAGGCRCHTDQKNNGAALAGRRSIKTPFGTLYGTNLTPDGKTGLGKWSEADFIRAMTEGLDPQGSHLFPVFPYPSFTRMARTDLQDIWAYLGTVTPVEQPNREHDLWGPFRWRFPLGFWKRLFFTPGSFRPEPARSPEWNRGAYLARAVAHCAECHTPRNLMGGLKQDWAYAGSSDGPEGELAPNITPDEATGIGSWREVDLVWFFQTGFKPDGDDVQGLMSELIEYGYQFMRESDMKAIYAYLRSLPPISNRLTKKKE